MLALRPKWAALHIPVFRPLLMFLHPLRFCRHQQTNVLLKRPDMNRSKEETLHESIQEACLAQWQPSRSVLSLFMPDRACSNGG